MLDQPVDFEQARTLLLALGAKPDELPGSPTFEDLLYELETAPVFAGYDEDDALHVGIDEVAEVLEVHGHAISVDGDTISYRGRSIELPDEDFWTILAAIEVLIDGAVEFRATALAVEVGIMFVGLPPARWAELEHAIPDLVERVFPAPRPEPPPEARVVKPGLFRRLFGR